MINHSTQTGQAQPQSQVTPTSCFILVWWFIIVGRAWASRTLIY